VQHLDFLSADEKAVFKTAFEIDQRWVIDLAADRTPFICQSQSLNIFLPADAHKKELHMLHYLAWKKGVKSLYYCRSKSLQRAEKATALPVQEDLPEPANTNFEECLSCQ
jgi:ribonucleoside-diphosphate reductase alpha chain